MKVNNYEEVKNNVIAEFCNEYINNKKMDQFIEYRYKREDYKIYYNDEIVEIALNDNTVNDEYFSLDMLTPIVNDIIKDMKVGYIDGEDTAFIIFDLLERYISFFHMDELVEEERNNYIYTMVKNSSLIFYEVIRHNVNYNGVKSDSTFIGYTDKAGRDNINKYGYNESYLIERIDINE